MTEPPALPEWGRRLSGWNASAWRTSNASPQMRSAMTTVFLLERTPDIDALRERMERLTMQFPALRERVIAPLGPIGEPRMVVDPDFDIEFHLSSYSLLQPASWADLLRKVRRQSLGDLDRDRPLWRARLIDGLPDGRCAIVLVVHHTIADGQGAVLLFSGLLDATPEPTTSEDGRPPAPRPGRVDRVTITAVALGSTVRRLGTDSLRAARWAPKAALGFAAHPRRTASDATRMALSATRVASVPSGPLSPLMKRRSSRYTVRTLDVDFEALRRAGKRHGGSLNDAYLTAITGGIRRYHEHHDTTVERIRVNVPVSLRRDDQRADTNAVSIARVELVVAETDVAARIEQAHEAMERARAEPFLPYSDLAGDLSRWLPIDLVVRMSTASDVTASNVPGSPVPVWMGGARLLRAYPVAPTIGAAANITMLSYARKYCSIGISTDDAAVEDPDLFRRCLAEGFVEIGAPPGPAAFNPLADENQPD